ncbi:MAG: response regulator [Dehalococcoidia bacterium]
MDRTRSLILIADSSRSNLEALSQHLQQAGYDTLTAASLEELDRAIRESGRISLALVDISGFHQDVWQRCRELSVAKTPCIVISPRRSPTVQRRGMEHGVSGLLISPLDFANLLEHIHGVLGD